MSAPPSDSSSSSSSGGGVTATPNAKLSCEPYVKIITPTNGQHFFEDDQFIPGNDGYVIIKFTGEVVNKCISAQPTVSRFNLQNNSNNNVLRWIFDDENVGYVGNSVTKGYYAGCHGGATHTATADVLINGVRKSSSVSFVTGSPGALGCVRELP